MGISLQKIETQAPGLVSLAKKAKEEVSRRGLENTPAKVALVLDYSGSMAGRYNSGEVQQLAERALALASQLDDDGSIDVFAFGSTSHYIGELSLGDYKGGIDRLVAPYRYGTTDYAGAFDQVREHFFPGAAAPVVKKSLFGRSKPTSSAPVSNMPVYAIFATDGAPDSKPKAVEALTKASAFPIFWKFLSVGNEDMAFLQKLDDLKDRVIDNADYKPVGTRLAAWSDQDLFDALLDEYPEYLKEARKVGILA